MKPAWARGLWRLVQPVRYCGLRRLVRMPGLYCRFLADRRRFVRMGGVAPFEEVWPFLFDRDPSTQSGGGHYFYQDIWALRRLARLRPAEHHDVGSRFDGFVGQATAITRIVCWDIRPPAFSLPDFEFRQGSILAMPLPDRSVMSLSCLHVAEHIGLGRYGDPLDPTAPRRRSANWRESSRSAAACCSACPWAESGFNSTASGCGTRSGRRGRPPACDCSVSAAWTTPGGSTKMSRRRRSRVRPTPAACIISSARPEGRVRPAILEAER